jgi:protein tyrosine/serine phosphatase
MTETFTLKPRSNWLRPLITVIALTAVGFVVWRHYFATYHLATVQEGVLYRDGARSVHELESAIDKVHPRTVVCLVDDNEIADPAKPQFAQEFALLKQRGIKAERVPVKLGGWPSTQDIRRFLSVTAEPGNQPVLVHCAQGVRRTAMMVAAYQESTLGYDKEKAKAAILTFGHSDSTVNDIRRFIDGYDPKTQTVSPELAK